jgi:hypothetical protein
VARAVAGAQVKVGIFGRWIPATITPDPLYDPTSIRVRT